VGAVICAKKKRKKNRVKKRFIAKENGFCPFLLCWWLYSFFPFGSFLFVSFYSNFILVETVSAIAATALSITHFDSRLSLSHLCFLFVMLALACFCLWLLLYSVAFAIYLAHIHPRTK